MPTSHLRVVPQPQHTAADREREDGDERAEDDEDTPEPGLYAGDSGHGPKLSRDAPWAAHHRDGRRRDLNSQLGFPTSAPAPASRRAAGPAGWTPGATRRHREQLRQQLPLSVVTAQARGDGDLVREPVRISMASPAGSPRARRYRRFYSVRPSCVVPDPALLAQMPPERSDTGSARNASRGQLGADPPALCRSSRRRRPRPIVRFSPRAHEGGRQRALPVVRSRARTHFTAWSSPPMVAVVVARRPRRARSRRSPSAPGRRHPHRASTGCLVDVPVSVPRGWSVRSTAFGRPRLREKLHRRRRRYGTRHQSRYALPRALDPRSSFMIDA